MHCASIRTRERASGPGSAGNRTTGVRRSLYVALTVTILIGQVW
jgi:hypothetical protein